MAAPEARRDLEDLSLEEKNARVASLLAATRQEFPDADEGVLTAIEQLATAISDGNVVYAAVTRNGHVWKSHSVLNVFVSLIDPPLQRLLPPGHFLREALVRRGMDVPLGTHLTNQASIKPICLRLREAAEEYEQDTYENIANQQDMFVKGETLIAVAETLETIKSEFDTDRTLWCELCFRRAPETSPYCDRHRRKQDSRADAKYRKAAKVREAMPEDIAIWIRRKHAKRALLGEQVRLMAEAYDVPGIPSENYVVVNPAVKYIVDLTMSPNWGDASAFWDDLLRDYCPMISAQLGASAQSFKDWDSFVAELLQRLQNNYEDTRHPLWVFEMLVEAENWLKLEASHKDGRTTETRREIIRLFQSGLTSATEIATAIGKSSQYVSRVLGEEGLRQGGKPPTP